MKRQASYEEWKPWDQEEFSDIWYFPKLQQLSIRFERAR
jgi:hypothetical protein